LNIINNNNFLASGLLLLATAVGGQSAIAQDCIPQGVEESATAVSIPAEFPGNIPLPPDYSLMSATFTPPDEYNPYPNVSVEMLVESTKEEAFAFFEQQLPASGYRIVMWEKDEGATGFRIRNEDIDQATITLNEYDCRAYVMFNVSLFP
jgi:hypothetical protein